MAIDSLKEIVAKAVSAAGYRFIGLEYVTVGRLNVLRVYIDGEQGVTIDDCAKASRQISAVLDVEEAMSSRYNLEVSSPGINRLLFELDQYRDYIGSMIQVKLRIAQEGRKQFKGILEEVNADHIVLWSDEERYSLAFRGIAKANLIRDKL
jgi:ribosome maturation factor RimP